MGILERFVHFSSWCERRGQGQRQSPFRVPAKPLLAGIGFLPNPIYGVRIGRAGQDAPQPARIRLSGSGVRLDSRETITANVSPPMFRRLFHRP